MRTAAMCLALLFTTAPARGYWIKDCHSRDPHLLTQVELVADLNPGGASAVKLPIGQFRRDQFMAAYQGELFFMGDDGKSGPELWRVSPGKAPSLVADLVPGPNGSAPHAFSVFQDKLFFAAFTPFQDKLFFVKRAPDTKRPELWWTEGFDVKRVATLSTAGNPADTARLVRIVYGDALLFNVTGMPGGVQLWRYDGKNEPAKIATSGSFRPNDAAVFNDKVFFAGPGGWWLYDGAAARRSRG